MNKKTLEQIEIIKAALRQLGEAGASVEEIKAAISTTIPHRTLQRRLEEMQQQGIATTTGEARRGLHDTTLLRKHLNNQEILVKLR